MFWKLTACVLSMGLFGCALLALRQARLQAAHELTQTQLRIRVCDERLFKLRAEIDRHVRPDDVRSMVVDLAALKPVTAPPAVPADPSEALAPARDPLAKPTKGKPPPASKKSKDRTQEAASGDADDARLAAHDRTGEDE